jgi:hypothetical protein
MALGSTQPLTEMSTRCIFWGKGGRCVRLTTLQPSCAVVMKCGNLDFLEPSGPLRACNGTALPLPNIFEIGWGRDFLVPSWPARGPVQPPFNSIPFAEGKVTREWHWPSTTNQRQSEGRTRALPLLSLWACAAFSLTYGLPSKILCGIAISRTRYISCLSILIRLPQKWTGKSSTQEYLYLAVFSILLRRLCLALIYCL